MTDKVIHAKYEKLNQCAKLVEILWHAKSGDIWCDYAGHRTVDKGLKAVISGTSCFIRTKILDDSRAEMTISITPGSVSNSGRAGEFSHDEYYPQAEFRNALTVVLMEFCNVWVNRAVGKIFGSTAEITKYNEDWVYDMSFTVEFDA